MIVTSGFLTALECTEFVFGRGSAPYPAGSLQCSQTPSWFKGSTKGKDEGKRARERKGRGGNERGGENSRIHP